MIFNFNKYLKKNVCIIIIILKKIIKLKKFVSYIYIYNQSY